jgi:hypothetical protein
MTIKSLYPNTFPALDLNFARSKRLDSRITFTRASAATHVGPDGLIKIATNNTSRFDHNPSTGESLGFLMEDGRTNECTYSNDFTARSGHWGNYGTGTALDVTLNAGISPDGTNNAALLTAPDASGCFYRNNTAQIGTAVKTFSIFLKAGTTTSVGLRIFSGQAPNGCSVAFNLANGTYTLFSPSISVASMVAFPNNWYRCSFARTDGNDKQPCNFEGIAQGNFYAYGAQSESGAFSTSYIPTTSATVTRAADTASITGANFSNWFNQSEGTTVCSFRATASTSGFYENSFAYATGTSSGQQALFRNNSDTSIGYGAWGNGVSVTVPNWLNTNNKVAGAYKINSIGFGINGSLSTSASTPTVATSDTLRIGEGYNQINVNKYNGTIARLAYYPTRLPDTQLIALTQ